MVSSAVIELRQSKKELMSLMKEQSHQLLEALLISSGNALSSNQITEKYLKERLLNNANFIRYLYETGQISNQTLTRFARENNLFRINIFRRDGQKIYSSHEQTHFDLLEKNSPHEILAPIFEGVTDTLFIGMKEARYESGFRYAIAIAAKDRSAIVVNLDAEQILSFRKQVGFGIFMRSIIQNPGIVYVALQDTTGILAASGNVRELESIETSPFILKSWQDSTFATRITEFDSVKIFEAVHPFYFQKRWLGMFRLGISLAPIQTINARIYRRIIVISAVLIFIGLVLFSLVLVRQNLEIVQKQYQVVESYSAELIENMKDAVIVLDSHSNLKIFNQAAVDLFQISKNSIIGEKLTIIFEESICESILLSAANMQEVSCKINKREKQLLISKSKFEDENKQENTILIIRDLTEQKNLEDQLQRRERLSAMGELASGVAHEIRNPLNAISTTIQQLDKDFEPVSNKEEYHQLSRMLYKEVRRINETVQSFLHFARPEPLQPSQFQIKELFDYLENQYASIMDQHQIEFQINLNWEGEVFWDKQKIQQVFMNLIQNAVDAIEKNGKIIIDVERENHSKLKIHVSNNGPGIPEQIRSKIFNLYFTTKAKGTGIGLAIVQQIIFEHCGTIKAQSENQNGAIFQIIMPAKIQAT
jgi:two-component system sensor histidine kinase HydH